MTAFRSVSVALFLIVAGARVAAQGAAPTADPASAVTPAPEATAPSAETTAPSAEPAAPAAAEDPVAPVATEPATPCAHCAGKEGPCTCPPGEHKGHGAGHGDGHHAHHGEGPQHHGPCQHAEGEAKTPCPHHGGHGHGMRRDGDEPPHMPHPWMGPPAHLTLGRFAVQLGGYVRAQGATFIPGRFFGVVTSRGETTNPNVGQNDGFALGDARLNIRARYKDMVYARLSFDGAVVSYEDPEAIVGHLSTGLKDAYLRVTPTKGFNLWAGRFKPPYDAESLTAVGDLQFVHRALESEGIARHEGYGADLQGLAPGRQLGVMAAYHHEVGESGRLGYGVAVTNGNSGDFALNDNDVPAVWARLGYAHLSAPGSVDDEEGPATQGAVDGFNLGLSGVWNTLTAGRAPNRVWSRVFGAGLDAAYRQNFGSTTLDIRGQILWQNTTHLAVTEACAENSLGGHAQAAVRLPNTNIYPAFRFALYEARMGVTSACASGSDGPDDDQVQHYTGGFRWDPESWPLSLWLEYTHSKEQGSRAVSNDRVEAAIEVDFD